MASLEERIQAAFAGNRYPGDDHLTVYRKAGRRYDETFQLLQGRTWQQLPVAEFMSGDTPIPDLAPEAFHYYMPALLLASLDEQPDLAQALAFYLTPSSCPDVPEHRSACLALIAFFSPEQRQVAADVLREYVRREWEEEADVREAIGVLEKMG